MAEPRRPPLLGAAPARIIFATPVNEEAAMEGAIATKRATTVRSFTRGVHHLALCTDDMKKTAEFYTRVLGMPLVHAMKVPPGLGTGPGNRGNPPYEEIRHYFFDMGNDSLLAFFEIPKGKEPRANRNAIGAMQHCAFVVTPERFREIEARLKANKIHYRGPIPQLPGLEGIYFFDPNGFRLEFACQIDHGEAPQVVAGTSQTKAEAARELATVPGADAAWIEEMTKALPEG
jgi:catechol 2,3-dioxygenase-like lactoylglutathione lyase family enzyme